MKKVTAILLLLMAVSTIGCLSSIVKNAAKDTPISNKIDIHSGAAKGDYAVLKSVKNDEMKNDATASMMTGETTTTFKIVKKGSGHLTIRQEISTSMIGASFMNNLVFEITSDYKGNVVKGFLIDADSGERTPLKIAKQGDDNYYAAKPVSASQLKKWGIPTRIKVPAGIFSVKGIMSKSDDSENIVVFLMNPKAKFGHVASYSVYPDPDTGEMKAYKALELVKQGRN
ncbi:MAG: hypothetical protein JW864_14960 [Spirochaetes bacterium]|nr:hypothetical protein [Spirochaetota bacterium]